MRIRASNVGRLAIVVGIVSFGGANAAAQETVGASMDASFAMIERSFVDLAEAMPADGYTFRPTTGAVAGVRTFGEQVKHVACANVAFFNQIESKTPPGGCDTGGPSPARTKPELVAYLKESFVYARTVLATLTAANALDPSGGPYGGRRSKLGVATLAVWHASDHYGQLVVYARLNGLVPPASAR
jgi:DinB family protein